MKKILIATDGSPASREAIELGLELAEEQAAEVTFLHVVPVHRIDDVDRKPLDVALALADERSLDAKAELLVGVIADEIVAYADTVDADLVVLGSGGRSAIATALLGSVSRGVLHEARRPVLLVPGAHVHEPEPAGS